MGFNRIAKIGNVATSGKWIKTKPVALICNVIPALCVMWSTAWVIFTRTHSLLQVPTSRPHRYRLTARLRSGLPLTPSVSFTCSFPQGVIRTGWTPRSDPGLDRSSSLGLHIYNPHVCILLNETLTAVLQQRKIELPPRFRVDFIFHIWIFHIYSSSDLNPHSAVVPIDFTVMAQDKQLIITHSSLRLGRGNRSLPRRCWPVYVRVLWLRHTSFPPGLICQSWAGFTFCFRRQLANMRTLSLWSRPTRHRTFLKRASLSIRLWRSPAKEKLGRSQQIREQRDLY